MQSLVSMIVPCYNKEPFIGTLLESICSQRWSRLELIFVNDGSTDGTRDVITSFLPRFLDHGYHTIILDTENHGVGAAVLEGLRHATGDYICTVDCDDSLHPEYASRMASFLDAHPEYDWTACSYSYSDRDITFSLLDPSPDRLSLYTPTNYFHYLELFIFQKIAAAAWIYLARAEYLRRCHVVDFFCATPRATQEPQFVLPLLAGRGLLKYISEPLYIYNVASSNQGRTNTFEQSYRYFSNYNILNHKTIRHLPLSEAEKSRLRTVSRLFRLSELLKRGECISEAHSPLIKRFLSESVRTINYIYRPEQAVLLEDVPGEKARYLGQAIAHSLFPGELELSGETVLKKRRNIVLGALGDMGRTRIPTLMNTSFQPHILWDMAARHGDTVCGIPVEKPSFANIQENDVFLIMPTKHAIVAEINNQLRQAGAKHIVCDEIMAPIYFPAIYHGSPR